MRLPPYFQQATDYGAFAQSAGPFGAQSVTPEDPPMFAEITSLNDPGSDTVLPSYCWKQLNPTAGGTYNSDGAWIACGAGSCSLPAGYQASGLVYDLGGRDDLEIGTIVQIMPRGTADANGLDEWVMNQDEAQAGASSSIYVQVASTLADTSTGASLYPSREATRNATLASWSYANNCWYYSANAIVPLLNSYHESILLKGTVVGAAADPIALTNATNATPIVITSTAHGLSTGDSVTIVGVLGNTAANGTWTITRVDADHFTLDTSTGNGAYGGGGTWVKNGPLKVYGDSEQALPLFIKVTSITPSSGYYPAIEQIDTNGTIANGDVCSYYAVDGTVPKLDSLHSCLQVGVNPGDPTKKLYADAPAVGMRVWGQANELPALPGRGPRRTVDFTDPYFGGSFPHNLAVTLADDAANDRMKWTVDNLGLYAKWKNPDPMIPDTLVGPRRSIRFIDGYGILTALTDSALLDAVVSTRNISLDFAHNATAGIVLTNTDTMQEGCHLDLTDGTWFLIAVAGCTIFNNDPTNFVGNWISVQLTELAAGAPVAGEAFCVNPVFSAGNNTNGLAYGTQGLAVMMNVFTGPTTVRFLAGPEGDYDVSVTYGFGRWGGTTPTPTACQMWAIRIK